MKDMVWRVPLVSIVVCLLLPVFLGGLKTFASEQRPNIVVILVDDLGYSDLGCYGGEIETPHLDRMAAEGIRFTQFYNTARCWPTRSALMTGYYAQTIGKDAFPGVKSRGSRGTRPRFAPLASLPLAMSGYRNYHVGKWHLDGLPTDNDFHRSYWLRDHNRLFTPEKHFLDDVALPVVKKEEGYYATDAIAQYAVDFLAEHANGHPNTPFFAYVCFNVPHFPLQAPQSTIKKYDGRYDLGPSPMRRLRFERLQKQLDFRSELSEVEPDVGPPYSFEGTQEELGGIETFRPAPWEDLTAEQQQFQADKMEIHAAMVDHIDQGVGRILDQIEAMGETDNTLVVFLSDNGASAEIMVRGDGHQTNAARGSRDTYLCLGPGFSNACNTPFRKHKTWVHEGGCATPMIVRWPAVIDDPGSLRHDVGHVIDFWTTFQELSGAPKLFDVCIYKNAPAIAINPLRRGRSLVDTFSGDTQSNRSLWWLHDGHEAFRDGDWKIVRSKNEAWELFKLSEDRAETNDLSKAEPKRLDELLKSYRKISRDIRQSHEVVIENQN